MQKAEGLVVWIYSHKKLNYFKKFMIFLNSTENAQTSNAYIFFQVHNSTDFYLIFGFPMKLSFKWYITWLCLKKIYFSHLVPDLLGVAPGNGTCDGLRGHFKISQKIWKKISDLLRPQGTLWQMPNMKFKNFLILEHPNIYIYI